MAYHDKLSEDQLKSLGFQIEYKKVKGVKTFNYCWIPDDTCDFVGEFYTQPSMYNIVMHLIQSTREETERNVKERISSRLMDMID